jgi:hypothetical protein
MKQPKAEAGQKFNLRNRIEIQVIESVEDIARFNQLLEEEHYLGATPPVGDFMRQVAVIDGKWVSCIAWGSPAYALKDRDRWIGWDARRRKKWLKLVVEQRRFLILESAREPNLASAVLGASLRAISDQWKEKFGYRPVLAETFTDIESFSGTCYKASNWIALGVCAGNSRVRGKGTFYTPNGRPKKLWVKEIDPRARKILTSDDLAEEHKQGDVGSKSGELPIREDQVLSLREVLRTVKDPRDTNTHYRIGSVLSIIAMAMLTGCVQVTEMKRFCNTLSQSHRALLGLPRKKKSAFYKVPGYNVFYDVLKGLDPDHFATVLNGWINQNRGELPGTFALDGKSIRDRAMIVSLTQKEGPPVAMAVCEGKGHEKNTGKKLLKKTSLDECIITGDALHCDRETAQIIAESGGDYVFQVKDNQKHLLKRIKKKSIPSS